MKHLTPILHAGLALACASSVQAEGMDITAIVIENSDPGGYVHYQDLTIPDTEPAPKQSANLLYLQTRGHNFSGHSGQIADGFASALAESDGNGGVGVNTWLGGNGSAIDPLATGELTAQAIWRGSFNYLGSDPGLASLHFQVPTIDLGLLGVPPNRDGYSNTETARATVQMSSLVTHADGTTSPGRGMSLQLSVQEYQAPVGPDVYANFAYVSATGDWDPLWLDVADNDSLDNPEWANAPFGGNAVLGVVQSGDTVSWVYSLLATGTTLGHEHGFYAYIGDPFGLDVVGGNLVVSTSPVPEPQSWLLLACGLAMVGWRQRASR